MRDIKTENCANSGRFDYWIESVIIIEFKLLMKALCNKASFVVLDRAIGVTLNLKDPFIAYYIVRWRGRDQEPSVILDQSLEFFSYGITPFKLLDNLHETSGFSWLSQSYGVCLRERKADGAIYTCFWAGEYHHEVVWSCDKDAQVEVVEAQATPELGPHVVKFEVQPAQCLVVEWARLGSRR